MEEQKYLYCYEVYGNDVVRYPIIRETNSNVWIKTKNGIEIQISKKTYSTGSDVWSRTHYHKETPELKIQWIESNLKRNYKKKLEQLKTCQDKSVMISVLAIEIPEEKKDGN